MNSFLWWETTNDCIAMLELLRDLRKDKTTRYTTANYKFRLLCAAISTIVRQHISADFLLADTTYVADDLANAFSWTRYALVKQLTGPTHEAIANSIRDIFDNPFQVLDLKKDLVAVAENTLVQKLTIAARDKRVLHKQLDPERLKILSDAIEDAGMPTDVEQTCPVCGGAGVLFDPVGVDSSCFKCIQPGQLSTQGTGKIVARNPLLLHLRSDVNHWCGCWAVDAILREMYESNE